VLPNDQSTPSPSSKQQYSLSVSLAVSLYFRCPVFSICLRICIMTLTTVSEASVYKNCDFCRAEDNVGSPIDFLFGPFVNSVVISRPVQQTTNDQFRRSVNPLVGPHHITCGVRRSFRSSWHSWQDLRSVSRLHSNLLLLL
jgi:hypothetical protein